MGKISGAFILPHPPIMVQEVGGSETQRIQNTIDAAREVGRRIAAIKPDTVIVITPHGTLFSDAISILSDERLSGDLSRFGVSHIQFDYENDLLLADKILEVSRDKGIFCAPITEDLKTKYGFPKGLDHGAIVPLYFINKAYKDFKLVHINYSMLPYEDHYRLGEAIKEAVGALERRAVIVASGDLSHHLTEEAHAGYNPAGAEFDKKYTELIESGDIESLLRLEPCFIEAAGECGLISTIVLFGALDGCNIKGEVLSYEGPFGVGYCVAELHAENCGGRSDILDKYTAYKKDKMNQVREGEDPYVRLARKTLENFIKTGDMIDIPEGLPEDMVKRAAGVFVSIKKHGQLRGCIGTITPTRSSIAEEILQNAVSAGSRDPRFDPIEEDELEDLVYSVDVLEKPEPIDSKDRLDVKRYGVIVTKGHRSGLLLPNLEGIDTIDEQLRVVLQKAGIGSDEKYEMARFEVIRHH